MPTELEKALQDTLQQALKTSEHSLGSLQKSMNGLAQKVSSLEDALRASTEREKRMTMLCNALAERLEEVQAEQETLHLFLEKLSNKLNGR